MKEETSNPTPDQPLVSISMCTYNGECFLQKQLDSIIAQDYPHLEVIICDDGSTDSTPDILTEYAEKYDFIKVVLNPANLGVVKNCEKVLGLCSGKYISPCDQDDIWLPKKISTLVDSIGDASLIYAQLEIIDENDNPIGRKYFNRGIRQALSGRCNMPLIFQNFIPGNSLFFKRELLDSIRPIPAGLIVPDQWIAVIAATANGVKFHDEVLSLYREHQTNISLKNKTKDAGFAGFLRKKKQRAKKLKQKFTALQILLNTVAELKFLPDCERELIQRLATLHRAYYRVLYNRKLSKLMKEQEDSFLANIRDKKKSRQKFCRGYLAELLR